MTVEIAEGIIEKMHMGAKVAVRHRFAGDKGTILRLDNDAMVNIFDDGRYYIQGDNTVELVIAFGIVEQAWDPDTWTCQSVETTDQTTDVKVTEVSPRSRPIDPGKRFEF